MEVKIKRIEKSIHKNQIFFIVYFDIDESREHFVYLKYEFLMKVLAKDLKCKKPLVKVGDKMVVFKNRKTTRLSYFITRIIQNMEIRKE